MGLEPTMPAYLPGGLSIVGVSDVVDGLLAAAERGLNGEHYILGGENLTYNQAVSRIANAVDGSPARIRVPATAIHAAGPVAEAASSVAGVRMFPFDRQMAQLATKRLFLLLEQGERGTGVRLPAARGPSAGDDGLVSVGTLCRSVRFYARHVDTHRLTVRHWTRWGLV